MMLSIRPRLTSIHPTRYHVLFPRNEYSRKHQYHSSLLLKSFTVFTASTVIPPRRCKTGRCGKHLDLGDWRKLHNEEFHNLYWSPNIRRSRDSSVGIRLGYGLDDRGSRVRFAAGAGNFSLHHCVQNGSGAHPPSYPMGTKGSFPGGKAAGE
jgi:hypothetical protein